MNRMGRATVWLIAGLLSLVGLITRHLLTLLEASRERDTLVEQEQRALLSLRQALDRHEGNLTALAEAVVEQRAERTTLLNTLSATVTRYRLLARTFPGAVALFNTDLIYELSDGAVARQLGIDPTRMEGTPVGGVLVNEADRIRAYAQACLRGEPQFYEQRVGEREYTVQMVPVRERDDGQVTGGMVVSLDVTEQRAAMAALAASEARYRLLAENATDMISRHDIHGAFVWASPAVTTLLGYTPEQIIGVNPAELLHPDDAHARDLLRQDFLQRGSRKVILRMRHIDGHYVWTEIVARVVVGLDGEPEIHAVTRDVTDRLRLEDQFLHAQKMESVGRVASSLAHDFNNMLTTMLGTLELIQLDSTLSAETTADLLTVQAAAERATALTRRLLTFTRQQPFELKVLDLAALVRSSGALIQRLIGSHIELQLDVVPGPVAVRADATQIEQLVFNLAINGRDAMPVGGTLRIGLETLVIDPEDAPAYGVAVGGGYACLRLIDTGHGMTPEVRAQMFEPFFTTKAQGKGTGLGLSTVYEIVRQHEGAIAVETAPGAGTQIAIYLPLTDQPLAAIGVANERAIVGGSETLLLVEDDDAVRAFAARVLRSLGYSVHEAENGAALLTADRLPLFDAVITDLVMPRVTGESLVTQLRQRFGQLGVVYITGYGADPPLRGVDLHEAVLLTKPFSAAMLAQAVRAVLDEPRR